MFESLTKPRYPKAGIGFSANAVTAVSLSKSGPNGFRVRNLASVNLRQGLLEPGFVEENIPDPHALADIVERAVTEAGLRGQKAWSVSLPSSSARTAILSVAEIPANKKEFEEVIDFKAETSFGVPASELRLSIESLEPSADGRARYLASAIRLDVIAEYESVLGSLGMRPGLVLPKAICEVKWLTDDHSVGDSVLISSQKDGFTALLLRGGQPALVRSVTCRNEEIDDEIYRLLVYYSDRYVSAGAEAQLGRFLVVGEGEIDSRVPAISSEALGVTISPVRPGDLGLEIGESGIPHSELLAPAGVAKFGWR